MTTTAAGTSRRRTRTKATPAKPLTYEQRLDTMEAACDRLEKLLAELLGEQAPPAEYEVRCQRLVVVDDEGRERLVAQSAAPGRFTLEMVTADGAARITCNTNDDPEGGHVAISASSKRGDASLYADGGRRADDDDDWMAAHLAIEQTKPRGMTTISSSGVEIVEDMNTARFTIRDGELRVLGKDGHEGVLLSAGTDYPSMHLLDNGDIDVTIDQKGISWGLA